MYKNDTNALQSDPPCLSDVPYKKKPRVILSLCHSDPLPNVLTRNVARKLQTHSLQIHQQADGYADNNREEIKEQDRGSKKR